MPPITRVCYISIIIDLLLAVLENIAVGYLGYRPYTLEQETILQIINHVRGTLMYYTVGLPCVPDAKGKTGKKRPRSTRGSGGDARNSEDDDDEAGAGPPATRRQAAPNSLTSTCSVCGKEICPVCGAESCPVCGECHYHGSKERSAPSSDCVEVEVVEESPVAMTISSSSGDGGPKYQNGSDSSSLSSSPERSVAEDENTGCGDTEDENTGGGDAGLKEGQDVGSSSSSSDDDEEK